MKLSIIIPTYNSVVAIGGALISMLTMMLLEKTLIGDVTTIGSAIE